MTDDFLSRSWADNHHRMTDQIARAVGGALETIRVGLARANAYDFDAPWRRDRRVRR